MLDLPRDRGCSFPRLRPRPGAFHCLAQTPSGQDSHHLATIFRRAPDIVDRSRLFGCDAAGVFNDLVGQRLPP